MAEELNFPDGPPATSVDVIRIYRSSVDGLMHVCWPDGIDVSVPDLRGAWLLAQVALRG